MEVEGKVREDEITMRKVQISLIINKKIKMKVMLHVHIFSKIMSKSVSAITEH